MSTSEREQPRSTEKKYTESDMLAALLHGTEYEPLNIKGDIATEKLPEKNRPFWGWLRTKAFQYTTHGGHSDGQPNLAVEP